MMLHPNADPIHAMWLLADKFSGISRTIPIRWIQVFLYVAKNKDSEDLTQVRIAESLGVAQGVISEVLAKMGDKKSPKLGLLTLTRDPTNDARKTIELTSKGKKLLSDINIILNKE